MKLLIVVALCAVALFCAVGSFAAEVRGAWITSWDKGFYTPQEIDDTIAAAKKAGLNALFIEVRKFADSYYDSKIEPRGPEVPAGFDPLAYTIEKAHPEGMQVYAWVVVYRAWAGSNKKPPTDPNHILNKHPEWILKDVDGKDWPGDGMFLDPGVPEARDYIVSVFEDIVKRYKIDGLQYDYVRYPGPKWGYSDTALKRYYAETGATTKPEPNDPKWLQWRRDQVTSLVKICHDKIKAMTPNVAITGSTICYGPCNADFNKTSPYVETCQDWYGWMKSGYMDVNIPMNYKPETSDWMKKSFREWTDASSRWQGKGMVFQGIDGNNQSVENMLKQIEYVRAAGQAGWVLFSFNESAHRDKEAAELGAALAPAPKLPVNMADGLNTQASREAFDRGIKQAENKKYAEATIELKKAVELDPGYSEAFYRLGRCYLKMNKNENAREAFKKALEVNPCHEGANKELDMLNSKK